MPKCIYGWIIHNCDKRMIPRGTCGKETTHGEFCLEHYGSMQRQTGLLLYNNFHRDIYKLYLSGKNCLGDISSFLELNGNRFTVESHLRLLYIICNSPCAEERDLSNSCFCATHREQLNAIDRD